MELDLQTGIVRPAGIVSKPVHSTPASTLLSDATAPPKRSSEQQVGPAMNDGLHAGELPL